MYAHCSVVGTAHIALHACTNVFLSCSMRTRIWGNARSHVNSGVIHAYYWFRKRVILVSTWPSYIQAASKCVHEQRIFCPIFILVASKARTILFFYLPSYHQQYVISSHSSSSKSLLFHIITLNQAYCNYYLLETLQYKSLLLRI